MMEGSFCEGKQRIIDDAKIIIMRSCYNLKRNWILKLILFGFRNLLTLQHIDVINELFDLEWVDTWVWENPSIFIILSV